MRTMVAWSKYYTCAMPWIVLVCVSHAQASGFYIAEQGAKATGTAGAFVADASDPSAIHYNPAGLTQLDGLQVTMGAALVAPSVTFLEKDSKEKTNAQQFKATIPQAYVSYALAPGYAVGLGFNAPYGLEIRWPKESPGNTVVRRQALQTFFITSAIALDASSYLEGLSIALGLDLVPARVFLSRNVAMGTATGSLEISGSAFGAGARIGALYKAPWAHGLCLGFSWRSPITLRFEGNADFDVSEDTPRSALPPDGDVATGITLPQSLSLGVSYKITSGLRTELDMEWYGWSVFEKLAIDLPDGSTSISNKAWNNTVALRAGLAYETSTVALRAGYAWDQTPVPDRTLDFALPDSNRHLAACGLGLVLSAFKLDVAFAYVLPWERDTASAANTPLHKGTYSASAWVVNVNVGFAWQDSSSQATSEDDGNTL